MSTHHPSLHALHVVLVGAGLQWPIFYTLFLTLKKAHTMYVSQPKLYVEFITH